MEICGEHNPVLLCYQARQKHKQEEGGGVQMEASHTGASSDRRRRWEAIPTLVNGSRGRKWALSGNRFGDKAPASTGGGGSTNGGDRLGPSPSRVGGDEVQLSGEHCGEPAGDVCCS